MKFTKAEARIMTILAIIGFLFCAYCAGKIAFYVYQWYVQPSDYQGWQGK